MQQSIMFLFPLVLGGVILLGVTVAIVRQLRKRESPAYLSVLTVVLGIALFGLLVKSIYKPHEYYKRQYETVVGVPLPESAEYTFADTWVASNQSNKTSSVAVITMTSDDAQKLEEQVNQNGLMKDSLDPKNYPYLAKQIKHVKTFTPALEIDRAYIEMREFDVPEDIRIVVKKLKKEGLEIPEETQKLRDKVEQDFVRIELDGELVKKVDYVKYFFGFSKSGSEVIVYILNE